MLFLVLVTANIQILPSIKADKNCEKKYKEREREKKDKIKFYPAGEYFQVCYECTVQTDNNLGTVTTKVLKQLMGLQYSDILKSKFQ